MAVERKLRLPARGTPLPRELADKLGLEQLPGGDMAIKEKAPGVAKMPGKKAEDLLDGKALTLEVPDISKLQEITTHEQLASILGEIGQQTEKEIESEIEEISDIKPEIPAQRPLTVDVAENVRVNEWMSNSFRITEEKIRSINMTADDITALFVGQELVKTIEIAPGMMATFRSLSRDEVDSIDRLLLERARDGKSASGEVAAEEYTYFQMQREADVKIMSRALVGVSWMKMPPKTDQKAREELLTAMPVQVYNLLRHWQMCFDAAIKLSLTEGNLKKS